MKGLSKVRTSTAHTSASPVLSLVGTTCKEVRCRFLQNIVQGSKEVLRILSRDLDYIGIKSCTSMIREIH